MPDYKTPGPARDRAAARKLVRTVVLAQGNIFIRELLRRKKIPIGITKQDFEGNLLRAINSGDLQLADLIEWLCVIAGAGQALQELRLIITGGAAHQHAGRPE